MTRHRLHATLQEWDTDWARAAPPGSLVPARWRLACPAIRDAEDIPDILTRIPADPDTILLGLLTCARAGDGLAGRAVLQAMMPKAVRLALRDPEASLSDVLAALWERISTYPIERRPRAVAANLALDTLKTIAGSRVRRHPPTGSAPPAEDDLPDGAAVLEAGARLGHIDTVTRRTLECVYLTGRSSRDAAAELGLSRDVVRWRCSRGVRALAAHRRELLADLVG
ncbi:MAG: RNA polymerase sigma factor [Propioniciclava sp.]